MKKFRFTRRCQWESFIGTTGQVVTEEDLAELNTSGRLPAAVVEYLLSIGALVEVAG